MGQRIDQFCEALVRKLTDTNARLDALGARIEGKAHDAQAAIRSHLDSVHKRIEHDRETVLEANARAKSWIELRKSETSERISQWKAERATKKLQDRADDAEQYAEDTVEIALSAIDEAELAALEAWLARYEADGALDKEAAHAAH